MFVVHYFFFLFVCGDCVGIVVSLMGMVLDVGGMGHKDGGKTEVRERVGRKGGRKGKSDSVPGGRRKEEKDGVGG